MNRKTFLSSAVGAVAAMLVPSRRADSSDAMNDVYDGPLTDKNGSITIGYLGWKLSQIAKNSPGAVLIHASDEGSDVFRCPVNSMVFGGVTDGLFNTDQGTGFEVVQLGYSRHSLPLNWVPAEGHLNDRNQ